ncbi:hypothetical protein Tco_1023972 [Tanacetum coccineum]
MLILDEFLTKEIRATDDYKEYETMFVHVDVLMNRPQPVISTQGTHRTTPRAHRTPTLTTASPQGKKRKQSAGETSSPRKSLKVTIRKKKQTTTPLLPPGDNKERDEMAEATLLSLTLCKTALAAEAQEYIAKVQEKLDEEENEKMVKGEEDEESYISEFADSMLNDDVDDFDESKDDNVKKTDDAAEEKDNDDQTDQTLVRIHATGSMETRNEKMQTPIPTPTRSPRKGLSLDKTILEELTAPVSLTTATTSKEVLDHCNNVVPELAFAKTNELIKEEMPRLVELAVQMDRELPFTSVLELISKEFATHGPKMIEELFRTHMQNTTLNLYPTSSTLSSSTTTMSTANLQYQLYLNMKSKPQDQAADLDLWEILKRKLEKP